MEQRLFDRTITDLDMQDNDYDIDMVALLKDIEEQYQVKFGGHKKRVEQLRVKQWARRLCEENITRCLQSESLVRNRNIYAKLLWKCVIILGSLEGPFRKVPPQTGQELPVIQPFEVTHIEQAVKTHIRKSKLETAKRAQEYRTLEEVERKKEQRVQKIKRHRCSRSQDTHIPRFEFPVSAVSHRTQSQETRPDAQVKWTLIVPQQRSGQNTLFTDGSESKIVKQQESRRLTTNPINQVSTTCRTKGESDFQTIQSGQNQLIKVELRKHRFQSSLNENKENDITFSGNQLYQNFLPPSGQISIKDLQQESKSTTQFEIQDLRDPQQFLRALAQLRKDTQTLLSKKSVMIP